MCNISKSISKCAKINVKNETNIYEIKLIPTLVTHQSSHNCH